MPGGNHGVVLIGGNSCGRPNWYAPPNLPLPPAVYPPSRKRNPSTFAPMRLFALLFSLYLACLSCLPCADEAVGDRESDLVSINASPHTDHGRMALGDWCSPLCQCHCCAGAVVSFAGAARLTFPLVVQRPVGPGHAVLVVAAPSRSAGTVWQPPRA